MEFINNVYLNTQSINFEKHYETVYEYIYIICDYSFNYCPLHYQMVYFYFPILYFLLNSSEKKKASNFKKKTSINYLFISLKNFFKKLTNLNVFFYKIILTLKKIFFFFKIFYLNFFKPHFVTLKKEIHKNHP